MDPGQLLTLTRALKTAEHPLVVTGAGISVASGIAPFRGTDDAVWSTTVLEMGTVEMFQRDPVRQWTWYLERFNSRRDVKPNAAHLALAEIDRRRGLRLVTQNVDGLHVMAGHRDVIEIHGAARKLRCSRSGCPEGAPFGTQPWDDSLFTEFLATGRRESLPRCPRCNKPIRAHVLWFDEFYTGHKDYRYADAASWLLEADFLLFVGTSFSVGVTDRALEVAAANGIPVWSIDPISPPPNDQVTWIQAPSEEVLPAVVASW
jgi:NAD-dependent deacetylase